MVSATISASHNPEQKRKIDAALDVTAVEDDIGFGNGI
jgi:hypothetical protein